MAVEWFKPRRYKHVDRPVCAAYAEKIASTPLLVEQHSFSPLIHYLKAVKRYKPGPHKTVVKERPIMYASHRDACILSCYSLRLNERLEEFYKGNALGEHVIAYRSLGKANYDFSAEVFEYAKAHSPCVILAFDVRGFFDTLDHRLLKARLNRILGTSTLSPDWYQVFKFVTKFHFLEKRELLGHPTFAGRFDQKGPVPIGTIAEIKEAGVKVYSNLNPKAGIPQGTPISASLSNLYMVDFDLATKGYCDSIGALYRRYSDDILVVCS
ncbi:MAG TPA: reverse transcriptase domain-containing protein, partial [Steroidobacteraceae bacterium]|nr:reverse transcriptase domain-containing protein [Steroidobacteraceae bacterium]